MRTSRFRLCSFAAIAGVNGTAVGSYEKLASRYIDEMVQILEQDIDTIRSDWRVDPTNVLGHLLFFLQMPFVHTEPE